MTDATTDTLGIRKGSRFPIDIDLDLEGADVRVARKIFKIQFEAGDVNKYNKKFIAALEKISYRVREDLTLSDADYNELIGELRDIGAKAYAYLKNAGIAQHIEWLEKREARKGISLDFTFPPSMSFLWQMMYTGGLFGDEVQPERFWGFHYPIGNLFWDSYTTSSIELKSGIFASTHGELTCAVTELNNLQELLDKIGGERTFVIKRLEDAMVPEELCSKAVFKYFNREDFGYGVVHFACHCVNPKDDDSTASLLLTAKEIQVELALDMFNTLAEEACTFQFSPLVFLNACESIAPLHFLQSLNFPRSLINFGAGGVIATACMMPDKFASAFATEFYQRLLKKSVAQSNSSIGETLMETSCYFLKEKNNPLGLAYGLYSATNQQLELE